MNVTSPSTFKIHHKEPFAIRSMSIYIASILPQSETTYIVLSIGTDRSTGDALGPLTGSFLSRMNLKKIIPYGTLHHPVHATNLEQTIDHLYQQHHNPFIIAIDASLGRSTSIGHFLSGTGSIQPGSALHKNLPSIGDVYITGVVNIEGLMNFTVLQNTRLSVIYDMAHCLSHILYRVDHFLDHSLQHKKVSE